MSRKDFEPQLCVETNVQEIEGDEQDTHHVLEPLPVKQADVFELVRLLSVQSSVP